MTGKLEALEPEAMEPEEGPGGEAGPGALTTARGALPLEALAVEARIDTFRFPLVVGPRYIPGVPLGEAPAGDGAAPDTGSVPDASRITPPVLLPGFPNPVRLSLAVAVARGGPEPGRARSSLHAVVEETGGGEHVIRVRPGARLDRDFVLRFPLARERVSATLEVARDPAGVEGPGDGTFLLTVVPPARGREEAPPRDVVFVLDRSGSMAGWKMVAARRAVARMVDTLGTRDRFLVLAFDGLVEHPPALGAGLVAGSDRNRFRAVELLSRVEARGGTEMAPAIQAALGALGDDALEREIVATSLGFGVLSRFTAFVAVETREVVNPGGRVTRVTQPVSAPSGWEMFEEPEGPQLLCLGGPFLAPQAAMAGFAFEAAAGETADRHARAFLARKAPGSAAAGRSVPLGAPLAARPPAPGAAAPVPLELAAYRQRASEIAGRLDGKEDDLEALRGVLRRLRALVDDLRSVGAPAGEINPLRELLASLEALLGGAAADPAEAGRLRASLREALVRFAGTGPVPERPGKRRFWK